MKKNTKQPKIRFKGFSGDWEQRELGEIITPYEDPVPTPKEGYTRLGIRSHAKGTFHNIVKKGMELETAQMHRVAPNKLIVNITFAWEHAVAITDNNDAGKLVSHRFPQFAFHDNIVPQFFKYVILDEGFHHHLWLSSPGGAGRNRVLKIDEMLAYKIDFPIKKEQLLISKFFNGLDQLIALHQRKLEKLKNIKKALLEKMFPKNGEKVPQIRFKGFTNTWEQRELGEIITPYEDPVPTPKEGYTRLGIRSHAKGTFHNIVKKGMELETAQMHRVAPNKLIVNITFAWEHAVAITDNNDAGKLVSHRFPQFAFHDNIVPQFFKYVILDEGFHHHLWLSSPGGAGRNRVLKIDEMLAYKIDFPIKKEQLLISKFFNGLDQLIALHQRKLEKLQNIKKACLEKMFV